MCVVIPYWYLGTSGNIALGILTIKTPRGNNVNRSLLCMVFSNQARTNTLENSNILWVVRDNGLLGYSSKLLPYVPYNFYWIRLNQKALCFVDYTKVYMMFRVHVRRYYEVVCKQIIIIRFVSK